MPSEQNQNQKITPAAGRQMKFIINALEDALERMRNAQGAAYRLPGYTAGRYDPAEQIEQAHDFIWQASGTIDDLREGIE